MSSCQLTKHDENNIEKSEATYLLKEQKIGNRNEMKLMILYDMTYPLEVKGQRFKKSLKFKCDDNDILS